MLERPSQRLQLALNVALLLATAWAVGQLPPGQPVPVHFNAQGVADGWSDSPWALFMLPGIAAALFVLQLLLPRLDPLGHNLQRSAGAVDTIMGAVTVLLAVLQVLIIGATLGLLRTPAPLLLAPGGALLMVVGNVLGKLRPNHSVGIRTPWTLANERVWDQTHRFAGKAFVAAGAVVLLLVVADLPAPQTALAVVGVTTAAAGASVLKSWLLWRRLRG